MPAAAAIGKTIAAAIQQKNETVNRFFFCGRGFEINAAIVLSYGTPIGSVGSFGWVFRPIIGSCRFS